MKLYFGISICLLIGAFLFFASIKAIKKNLEQKAWPQTSGVILSTSLKKSKIDSSEHNARLAGFRWILSVTYSYSVNGKLYEGSSITNAYDELVSTHRDVEDNFDKPPEFIASFMEEYQEDTSIKVYYRTENPRDSFMQYEVSWVRFVVFISISVFFLSTALFFYLYGARLNLV